MKLLIVLNYQEPVRSVYRDGLAAAFPHLEINLVDLPDKVGPFIRDAGVLVTFGAHMSDTVLEQAGNLKWIQALGTGVDGIVDRPALRAGQVVEPAALGGKGAQKEQGQVLGPLQ